MAEPVTFSCSGEGRIRVVSPRLTRPYRLLLAGDWHSAHDDERGEPFRQYSGRMARYHRPMEGVLAPLICEAAGEGADALLLAGDMISFPTEKGVEILLDIMQNAPVPAYFIAGNHDWHYEGLPGSDDFLRREWIRERLLSLYQGRDPMMYAIRLDGLKILMMDNSTSRILPEQLAWFREELSEDMPAVLCVHIPLYIPGMGQGVTSCIGHPDWGWESDPYFEIERRERWPRSGVSETTRAFLETAWASENLLGILSGHVHRFAGMGYRGKCQITAAAGQIHTVDLLPLA